MKLHRLTTLPAVACIAFALAACAPNQQPPGGSAGSAAGSSSGGSATCSDPDGLGACITVDISGAVTVKGSFATFRPGTTSRQSCADWAAGKGDDLTLPGGIGEAVGGHEVGLVNEVNDYSGPGSFEGLSKIGAVDGAMHVDVDGTQYQASEGAKSTVTAQVAPDGSGTVTFANLREADGTKLIKGSYSWTCAD